MLTCGALWNKRGGNGRERDAKVSFSPDMSNDLKTEPANESVRLNGTVEHSLDDKRRLQFPSRWRSENGAMEWTAVLWPNMGFLIAMPTASYTQMIQKLERRGRGDQNARNLMRYFSENSSDLSMDKTGRVALPEKLLKEVGIEKDVMLVGMGAEFEIWPLTRYREKAVVTAEVAEMNIQKYLTESEEAPC